jgi:hypothetical protein
MGERCWPEPLDPGVGLDMALVSIFNGIPWAYFEAMSSLPCLADVSVRTRKWHPTRLFVNIAVCIV